MMQISGKAKRKQLATKHRRFILLLAIFMGAALLQMATLPVMEGGDEVLHSNYAQYLLINNRLPDRSTETPGILQGSGQPPFYYWVGATVLRLLRVPPSDPAAVFTQLMNARNRWYAPPDQWNPLDNRNVFLHGSLTQHLNSPNAENAVRVLRFVSLAFGMIGVIGAYGALRELFPSESWALIGTAIFALTPQMVHMSAIFHNDITATTFPVLILWQTLRLLRRGLSFRRLLLIGVLLGLGGLSKINALLVAPAVATAILMAWYKQQHSVRTLIGAGLAVALPFLCSFGAWALWGWLTYSDPLGTATHLRAGYFFDPALTLSQVMPLLPEMVLGYWGKLGAAIYLHPLTYTLFGALLVLAMIGLIRVRPQLRGLAGEQALVLLIAALVTAAGVLHWLQTIQFITGRLLYPAHLAVAAAITAGLMRLPRRTVQTFALGTLMLASVVLAPLDITLAFQPPPLLYSLPPLQSSGVDYAKTIRLTGFQQDSPMLRENIHTVTLCWQVLQPTDQWLAYSIKFIHDGVIVGERTTVFGLGRFPSDSWQTGDQFCDAVDVPLTQTPKSGQVYDIAVVLLDVQTEASNIPATNAAGQAITVPFIGQVVSPAGDQRTAATPATHATTVSIPGLATLAGIATEGELAAGKSVDVTLVWNVTGQTTEDWAEYIHLIGPTGEISLADGVPRDGNYPTWAWSPGEQVVETRKITLPADLKPGDYQVVIGFYRPATGERVSILQDGRPALNDSATVLRFTQK